MKTAKERVLERYCGVQLVRDTGNSRYYILGRERGTSACIKVIWKISSATEDAAWELAAATLDPEPKEVTLDEFDMFSRLLELRQRACVGHGEMVEFGCDRTGHPFYKIGSGDRVCTSGHGVVAKLRELATPKPPVSKPIEWQEWTDRHGNTYWEAESPLGTKSDPSRCSWRIKQGYMNNVVRFYADHIRDLPLYDKSWDTIKEAKAAIQAAHDAIVREQKAGRE